MCWLCFDHPAPVSKTFSYVETIIFCHSFGSHAIECNGTDEVMFHTRFNISKSSSALYVNEDNTGLPHKQEASPHIPWSAFRRALFMASYSRCRRRSATDAWTSSPRFLPSIPITSRSTRKCSMIISNYMSFQINKYMKFGATYMHDDPYQYCIGNTIDRLHLLSLHDERRFAEWKEGD